VVNLIKNGDAFRHPGVYKIINTKTGKIYVGSSLDMHRRLQNHFRLLKRDRHHCDHLQSSFNKHGIKHFDIEVLEIIDISGLDLEDRDKALLSREQFWMDETKCYLSATGYNSSHEAGRISMTPEIRTKIGKGRLGKRHTDESKAKMADANRGKLHSEETRLKMSRAHKGKPLSEEVKRKLSGRKHSEESKEKISKAHKGKVVSEETRRKLAIASTGKKATSETKAKMSAAHSGRRHTEESKEKISKVHKGKVVSKETRHKLSVAGKRFAENKRKFSEEQAKSNS
jgi:group I intron endonuclease